MRNFLLIGVAALGLVACAQQPGQPTAAQNAGTSGGCEALPAPMPGSGTRMPASAVPTQNPQGGCEAEPAVGGTAQRAALPPTQNPQGGCEAEPRGTGGAGCEAPSGRVLPARPATAH